MDKQVVCTLRACYDLIASFTSLNIIMTCCSFHLVRRISYIHTLKIYLQCAPVYYICTMLYKRQNMKVCLYLLGIHFHICDTNIKR